MTEWALEIDDLRVDYGETLAVDGLTLRLPYGEVVGLVGPNGAGKTSTFKVMATLLEPTYGRVMVAGCHVADDPAGVRRALGYMPDLAPVPGDLKVWEFLDCFAAAHGLGAGRRARWEAALAEVNLEEKRDAFCNQLSRGMKQRLVLAKTMLHEPRVLVLDEPASGMDPVSRAALKTTLRHMRTRGATVVVSSHILGELAGMCTQVALLHQGRLVDFGPVDEVADRMAHRGKTLSVRVLAGTDLHAMAEWFSGREECAMVELQSGGLLVRFDGSPEEECALLREAVGAGWPLRHFAEEGSALERAVLGLHGKERGE